jgi:hypothetical protein
MTMKKIGIMKFVEREKSIGRVFLGGGWGYWMAGVLLEGIFSGQKQQMISFQRTLPL